MIDFYNRGGVCLLCGTDWVFKLSSLALRLKRVNWAGEHYGTNARFSQFCERTLNENIKAVCII